LKKSIEALLAEMQPLADAAEERNLTDEELAQYRSLKDEVERTRQSDEVRSLQAAYVTPNASVQAAVHVGTVKPDDTLERAFESYLKTGVANQDIAELRAQSAGSDAAGGYMVPQGFRQKLVEVQKSFGGLAPEVDNYVTDNGAAVEFPTIDDTANVGQITAEGANFAGGADLTFGTITLGAKKYTSAGANDAPLKVSVELLQDSAFDVASFVARALGTRIARKQASDFAVGTGTNMPFGIVHAGLTHNHELATTTTITYADLLDLEAQLDPAYEQNAKWVFNKATWTAVRKLEDDQGRPLIFDQAASGIGGAPQKTLLGYPVVLDQAFPNPTGDSTNFAVLGDLREAYVIRRVSSLVVMVNPYSSAASGQVEFTAWERADGNIQNRKAFVVLATEDVA
jgi:HK97 family phage major capsid protein